jgi:hypothetical protein
MACAGSDAKPSGATHAGGGAGTSGGTGPQSGGAPSGGSSARGGSNASGGSSASGGSNGGSSGSSGASPGGAAGASGDDDFEPTYGRYGEPLSTFTLPAPTSSDGTPPAMYHDDLASEFPDVAWDELDRLYIPAGTYSTLLLGGLPARSLDHPLVITNLGGQVKIGGYAANYVSVIHGGSGWVLTGRYDPISATGDASFRGHAEGAFAHSQGTYGIFIDDAFSKDGLSGLAIGDHATDFELDTLEITRAEFAGLVVKTDDQGDATMRNVSLHDLYVHDTGSEGLYLGSTQAQPQHSFEHLQIYDNRFIRTGTEALQTGQLGEGTEIHHNVLGPGAVRWRSAFADYQDGNVQFGQRYGSSSFHHNIVVGTGDLFVELFPTVVDGDSHALGDTVTFNDNYFSDTSASGVYTHAEDTGVTIDFERNLFRGFHFNYAEVHPDATEPVQVFGVGSNSPDPHVLKDNVVDGPYPFIMWTFPSVTESGNTTASIEPVQFRDFMDPVIEQNFRLLEWWTAVATRHPDMPAVTYPAGARVVHQGVLYEALSENSGKDPADNADVWRELPPPADDARLRPDSPHAGLGIRWPPP